MADRRFLVRFKPPEMSTQPVIADTYEIQGDHLAFFNSKGELAALFLLEIIESWSEIDRAVNFKNLFGATRLT